MDKPRPGWVKEMPENIHKLHSLELGGSDEIMVKKVRVLLPFLAASNISVPSLKKKKNLMGLFQKEVQ